MPLGAPLDYSFVAGDTASVLTVTCKRSDTGAVIDLTGASVALKYRIDGGTLQSRTMTIDADPSTGVVTYEFDSGDLTEGQMVAEVEVTTLAGITTSLEPFRFTIRGRV